MSSMCVHERSVYLWAVTAFLKVSLFFFFFCKSTQRGTMWPWIASLLSQSFDRKVKKKNLSVGFSWSWRPHTISHISDPVWLSHFVLSIWMNLWICVYVFFFLCCVLKWQTKLISGMCVSEAECFFYLVSTCWGLNWHSDSCFLDSEWECVCLYERGRIISQALASTWIYPAAQHGLWHTISISYSFINAQMYAPSHCTCVYPHTDTHTAPLPQ